MKIQTFAPILLSTLIFQQVRGFGSCSPNPCEQGAKCSWNSYGNAYCNCHPDFIGEYCQHKNPCNSVGQRCLNGGTCSVPRVTSGEPSFQCLCPIGYTGSLCELPSSNNPCNVNPCSNGATCTLQSLSNYTCTCPVGWKGRYCSEEDPCADNPCNNNGNCITIGSRFHCDCFKGFKGPDCKVDVNECSQNPCVQGRCINTPGSYKCECNKGFTGPHCEHRFYPCSPSPCQNGGVCSQLDNYNHLCHCPKGFEGPNCELNIDDCPGHLCQNGGRCIDDLNTYTCECPPGWSGKYCNLDVDECAMANSPCQNGATCANEEGGYSCICVNGFEGPRCEKNVDDCSSNPCLHGGTCHDKIATFYCECPAGRTGLYCHLKDACASNPCNAKAICETSIFNGSYTCSCPQGYSGVDCNQDVNECLEGSPCEHGGTCVNTPGSYRCDCQVGFSGSRCEVNVNECDSNPCQNEGTCIDERGSYRCICMPGYSGIQCETEVDDCSSGPCQNGGVCQDLVNGYKCTCINGFTGSDCRITKDDCDRDTPCLNGGTCQSAFGSTVCDCVPGFTGRRCEINVDDCKHNQCKNGGVCVDGVNSFRCHCHPGWTGVLCQDRSDACKSRPCQNGGFCERLPNGYQCKCPQGTEGKHCEHNINECFSNPCLHGNCTDGINRYFCSCIKGYKGKQCEIEMDECLSSPCLNGGRCLDRVGGFKCDCPRGYYGPTCASEVNACASSPCLNGGSCENGFNAFVCSCGPGFEGRRCESKVDMCKGNPCQHGGLCTTHFNAYSCKCALGYAGANCQENIDDCRRTPCKNGGSCIDQVNGFKCICEPPFAGKTCDVEEVALDPNPDPCAMCRTKSGNNLCDEECNTHQCNYDGGDCRLDLNPWKLCRATSQSGQNCWDVFKNDVCDPACNTKDCLFDGYDCENTGMPCDKLYDAYCTDHYGNGICDAKCNNEACGWDGLDCEHKEEKVDHAIIPGTFYVVLAVAQDRFDEEKRKRFVRYMSLTMRTNFRISKDANGRAMVFDYSPGHLESNDQMKMTTPAFRTQSHSKPGLIVYLDIDTVKCSIEALEDHCFGDVEAYANYFAAMMGKSQKPSEDWGIVQVGYAKGEAPSGTFGNTYGVVVVGLVIVALILAAIGVIAHNTRKRAKGVTWFPEGFSQPLKQRTSQVADGWPDEDPPERTLKKTRLDFSPEEGRQWTQGHLNAAGAGRPETPHEDVTAASGVDVRGPMGMTPLMIAATRPIVEDESTTAVIQDLISQDADVDAHMDKTGETPLHLAARYGRADAAKLLLDAGADVNAADHSGRTPLHSAVSTDAQEVLFILLKHRATNVNAQTLDGTTPLILSARLGIEGMVEDLMEAEADANLADEQGKTALHWAAAVNNVEAVSILLANGANRDALDHKDETPLFLAAREGSYQAARVLLDHCANRDLQDHVDRLPLQAARESGHQDIVRLLEDHIPPALPLSTALHVLALTSGQSFSSAHYQTLPGSKCRNKKRGRASPPPDRKADGHTLPRNAWKMSRKSVASEMMISSEKSLHPAGPPQFNSYLAKSQPNVDSLISCLNQPPSYNSALSNGNIFGGDGDRSHPMGFKYLASVDQEDHLQHHHFRQQSMPAMYANHLSPPLSNVSNQLQSPPPLGNNSMSSPPDQQGIMMSPPQSVQSYQTMSPPMQNSQILSPPRHHLDQQLSPPRSAWSTASNKIQSFDFCTVPDPNFVASQHQFIYPNQSMVTNTNCPSNYMIPSPDSPDEWNPQQPHIQYQNIAQQHNLALMKKQQQTGGGGVLI